MSKKKFSGNPPDGGVLLAQNAEWALYDSQKGVDGWRSLKLVSKERRETKANFWISCCEDRLAESRDKLCLAENYPELYDWVLEVLGL